MYCIYCGTQLPDQARFCNNCGKAQIVQQKPTVTVPTPKQATPTSTNTVVNTQPTAPQSEKAAKSEKKPNIFLRILAVFLAMVIGSSFGAPFGERIAVEKLLQAETYALYDDVNTADQIYFVFCNLDGGLINSEEVNPDYEAFFSSRGLDLPILDESACNVDMYAGEMDQGVFYNIELHHVNGFLWSFHESMYVPVAHLDEATRQLLDSSVMESFSKYSDLSFCYVVPEYSDQYYKYTLISGDLNYPDVLQQAISRGLLPVTADYQYEQFYFEDAESSLLALGYVKR